ncbi:MAG: hypothetical protein M1834_001539 [Cirrosporium novae-zelandiae]|nr:MAG: hypothetical protein M1834_004056 [Cirrosporium novae-zelandiae]KAI9735524.1 MAG: hypothetical protein M1834_001539 [Cirrosporium novae-zelandiae]
MLTPDHSASPSPDLAPHIRNPSRSKPTSFFRYLFPNTRQRSRGKLFTFRHETVPYYQRRLQSRIFRFLVDYQARAALRNASGRRQRSLIGEKKHHLVKGVLLKDASNKPIVSPNNHSMSMNGGEPYYVGETRERGSRRKKFMGYLKAANELRQTYQQSYLSQRNGFVEYGQEIPGAFPDIAIAQSGGEEMVLFPSYARRHIKKDRGQSRDRAVPETGQDIRDPPHPGDTEYWKQEWEKYEDDNAIVDVDVRGCIYSPHRGAITRKNRILISLARRLSGIPAPSGSPGQSRSRSRHTKHQEVVEEQTSKQEEEFINREAESIARRGEGEAAVAYRGGYSEAPSLDPDSGSPYSTPNGTPSRSNSPASRREREPKPGQFPHPLTDSSIASEQDEDSRDRRKLRSQPSELSRAELSAANDRLMARLRPFMANPLPGTPLTIFFYDDNNSQSRTLVTNDAGHFSIRAALDFIPTNLRVLASEDLSATEEVHIIEPTGVSLISDIDDTVKHSGIGSGAKEIFRNTFARELGDLTIDGVKEWYSKLAEMGVSMHYVSNSPWQLYPLLFSYFSLAGLPPGSFHLKQYSGMLQGIFEPVAERKKATLEKIMRDFPKRRFILVGDSGEADLEVYTDIVLANPGRVIGVFIRDVTTKQKKFFDQNIEKLRPENNNKIRPMVLSNQSTQSFAPPSRKPTFPVRYPSDTALQTSGPPQGNLIDFNDDSLSSKRESDSINTCSSANHDLAYLTINRSPAPVPPKKPATLRTRSDDVAPTLSRSNNHAPTPPRKTVPGHPPPPPPPPKPRRLSTSKGSDIQQATPHRAVSSDRANNQSYPSTIREKVALTYNNLPEASYFTSNATQAKGPPPPPPPPRRGTHPQNPSSSSGENGKSDSTPSSSQQQQDPQDPTPPTLPPRKALASYPIAAAQYAGNHLTSYYNNPATISTTPIQNPTSNNTTNLPPSDLTRTTTSMSTMTTASTEATLNKKEELWKRRWIRAEDLLSKENVVLRSWRAGHDVQDEIVGLVEREMRRVLGEERDWR